MTKKFVYNFGDGVADGDASMRNILGGKGANLAEMSKLNLPVPLGFTISTEVCDYYYKNNKSLPNSLQDSIYQSITNIENKLGNKFGRRRSFAFFYSLWLKSFNARNDGYNSKSWA